MLPQWRRDAPPSATQKLLETPLSEPQSRLLELLVDAYESEQRWPNWGWARRQLGTDRAGALAVLVNLPMLGSLPPERGFRYGLVWTTDDSVLTTGADHVILGLTVAGLWRTGRHTKAVDTIELIRKAAEASADHRPPPHDTTRPTITVPRTLPKGDEQVNWLDKGEDIDRLRREPPFRQCQPSLAPSDSTRWLFTLDDSIERYGGVTTIDKYVDLVGGDIASLQSPMLGTGPALTSSSRRSDGALIRRGSWWLGGAAAVGVGGFISDTVRSTLAQAMDWFLSLLQ